MSGLSRWKRQQADDAVFQVLCAELGRAVLDELARGVGHGCAPMDRLRERAEDLGLEARLERTEDNR